jgi:hypothetical protein
MPHIDQAGNNVGCTECQTCRRPFARRAVHQAYCSVRCRVTSLRQKRARARNAADPAHPSGPREIIAPRANPAEKLQSNQWPCNAEKHGDRSALWHEIVEIEIVARRSWKPVVSPDGVPAEVTQLSSRTIRNRNGR